MRLGGDWTRTPDLQPRSASTTQCPWFSSLVGYTLVTLKLCNAVEGSRGIEVRLTQGQTASGPSQPCVSGPVL